MPKGTPGNQGIENGVLGPEGCGVSWEALAGLPGPLYQYVVGAQMFLSEDISKNTIVNGTVKSLCCIKEINMNIGPSVAPYDVWPQQQVSVGIFDMYVE